MDKKEIILKHLKAYYYHKGIEINDNDILPMSRIQPMMDEYAQRKIKPLLEALLIITDEFGEQAISDQLGENAEIVFTAIKSATE